jgi:uncharacterized protein
MNAFHLNAEDLPIDFPIFPLSGALLLPSGRLPLNIFEPRYLAMVEDALAAGRMFGMVQPDGRLQRGETGPGLFKVGCLGRLASFSETEDGRYLITLTGVARFRILQELAMRRGYRRVRADYAGFEADLDPAPKPIGVPREALLSEMGGYFSRSGFDANWDAVRRISDEQLVTTLCMVCPFEPAEKQALLEAASDTERGAALLALLQMGALQANDGPSGRTAS